MKYTVFLLVTYMLQTFCLISFYFYFGDSLGFCCKQALLTYWFQHATSGGGFLRYVSIKIISSIY